MGSRELMRYTREILSLKLDSDEFTMEEKQLELLGVREPRGTLRAQGVRALTETRKGKAAFVYLIDRR